jgi:methylmalonyl-CoA mutase C-terminal domain/subunit
MVVNTAIQEDVDVIGISILSGAHNTLLPRVLRLLAERDAKDIAVFVGGIIPEQDAVVLREAGVAEIFTPGASLDSIVARVRAILAERGVELLGAEA